MRKTLEEYGLADLNGDEKAVLIFLLEESLAAEQDAWEPTPEQLAELKRRVAAADANPGRGVPWEVVRDGARDRLRARRGHD